MIPTYHPQIKVTLIKVVRRRGPRGLAPEIKEIDLTDWLGDQGSVIVTRQINAPGAKFRLTFADRLDLRTPAMRLHKDTLYSLVEPMDIVVIRMAREPHRYAGGVLPVVMRGFVDRVRRSGHVGSDGKPVRSVVVEGTDIGGKTLQVIQIWHRYEYLLGRQLLTQFPLFEIGVKFDALPASEFVKEVVKIGNRWLEQLTIKKGLDVPLKINVDARVKMGKVGPYGVQPYQGTLWRFIENWTDLAWNELIWEDRPDGPYLVYRPKPYVGLDGKLTSKDPGAAPPDEVEMDIAQVRSMDVSRSDRDVANYYVVTPTPGDLPDWTLIQRQALMEGGLTLNEAEYPDAAESVYGGPRKMEETTGQLADDFARMNSLPPSEKMQQADYAGAWLKHRVEELKAQCCDNVLWEEGHMTVQGWEYLRPGVNLILNRGALRASYYVTSVTHVFAPFRSYECELDVIRGTGFVERRKLSGSPYLAEGRRGVYGR
ncbi:MAG: hypothetical protein WC383_11675 [Gammaproteobacteria bacterium]